tara:strand:- start:11 stop:136 length:126 start_codon:yes stop_codon:yes gene_type:complete
MKIDKRTAQFIINIELKINVNKAKLSIKDENKNNSTNWYIL